jgi:hypothetical protein
MASYPHRSYERDKQDAQRIALFLTAEQIRWLSIGLGALPRAKREPLLREIDMQLAAHGVLN